MELLNFDKKFWLYLGVAPPGDADPSALQGSDDMPVIIILVVCIVGIFLLALNIGLIMFFIRRKRKRLESKFFFSFVLCFTWTCNWIVWPKLGIGWNFLNFCLFLMHTNTRMMNTNVLNAFTLQVYINNSLWQDFSD